MTALQVLSSDLQQKSNSTEHHTSDYIIEELVVRRGTPFEFKIVCNREVKAEDNLQWWAETGSNRNKHKVTAPISTTSSGQPWNAVSKVISETSMSITIYSPPNAPIGRYFMGVKTKVGRREVSHATGGFILLFNAWNPGDSVYMENDAERKEYVLNETGRIYSGTGKPDPSYRVWDFAQFEERILPICLDLMDISIEYRRNAAKDISRRGDPVYLSRIMSAAVNSQDENGVIVGRWSGDYEGGERPSKWNGSAEILRGWRDNGPVRYGQCWVYAGVLCTVLRCLGIPTRVITNFSSAHDTDENLTIDRYFDENGKETSGADSVWNFHVWDEAYFERKDLNNPKYNGWQTLDATPQEASGGIYCLGPCSVNAIKEGDIDQDYDAAFVYCEMNGDRVDWLYTAGELRRLRVDTKSIGRYTSTKDVGSNNRVDVTNNYKFAEGSEEERASFNKAVEQLKNMNLRRARGSDLVAFSAHNTEPVPRPNFEATFRQSSDPEVGKDVAFTLWTKNTSDEKTSLNVKFSATSIIYTNALANDILNEEKPLVFEPKEEKSILLNIPYTQYENAITTDNMIKAVAICEDEKGGKLLVESVMTLKVPPILIKTIGQGHVNKPLCVEVVFTNPLPERIEDLTLTVEGSGLIKNQIAIEVPCLKKHERRVTKLDITPYRTGDRCLQVNLLSDKLYDAKGAVQVKISPA